MLSSHREIANELLPLILGLWVYEKLGYCAARLTRAAFVLGKGRWVCESSIFLPHSSISIFFFSIDFEHTVITQWQAIA